VWLFIPAPSSPPPFDILHIPGSRRSSKRQLPSRFLDLHVGCTSLFAPRFLPDSLPSLSPNNPLNTIFASCLPSVRPFCPEMVLRPKSMSIGFFPPYVLSSVSPRLTRASRPMPFFSFLDDHPGHLRDGLVLLRLIVPFIFCAVACAPNWLPPPAHHVGSALRLFFFFFLPYHPTSYFVRDIL